MQIAETCNKTAKLDCGNVCWPICKNDPCAPLKKKGMNKNSKLSDHQCVLVGAISLWTLPPWHHGRAQSETRSQALESPRSFREVHQRA